MVEDARARPKLSHRASRMKATRVGFKACSGLKLPLGSHHAAATALNLCTSWSTMEGPAARSPLQEEPPKCHAVVLAKTQDAWHPR